MNAVTNEKTMYVAQHKLVSIKYVVTDAADGKIIDQNDQNAPMSFIFGANQVILGLEKALFGKTVGEKISTKIAPADAYGERQTDNIQEVPRAQFAGLELEAGMTLFGQDASGRSMQVKVLDFNDDFVMIDHNHPLSGKTLNFDVEILDVRDASDDEILRATNPMMGGCCGGNKGACGCE